MAIPGGMMDRVIQARKQQPGYNPNILGPLGQLMTGVGNLIQGRPYSTSFTGVGNIPPSARGESYRRAELRLADAARPGGGAAAERFRPGDGFPGQQQFPVAPVDPLSRLSPQDRAYQQERARVEAMVKSNPDMQKEEIAAARAKVRDQGMAIWAAKYGGPDGLASKVKPGQSGYETIQKTLYPGGAPLPAMSAESEAMLNAIAPPDATGVRPNVTPMPGQLPAFGNASEAMFQAVTGGGAYITPMPKEAVTPQTQAQDLAEAYRQAMLARISTNK